MSNDRKDILFPVGRLVGGSVHEGRDKDFEGKPLVYKTGANAGQPRLDYSIGVAIPKIAGHTHWGQTEWGAQILALGRAAFPAGQAEKADFSWKIQDSDSQVPNLKMQKPCDREGYPGSWVVWFSGAQPPRTCDAKGTAQIDPAMIKAGYWVQVFGNVASNASVGNPGIYMNHNAVSLQGYAPEISLGLDTSAIGFGGTALPAGATAAPVGMTEMPGTGAAPPLPATTVVLPNTALTAGAAPPPPGAAPAPPAPSAPVHNMTAAAGGVPYESFIAQGWTDAVLIQHGMMTA